MYLFLSTKSSYKCRCLPLNMIYHRSTLCLKVLEDVPYLVVDVGNVHDELDFELEVISQ